MLVYGSVCSGLEMASLAWQPLGWRCAFMSEIEPFARAILKHRWPGVPLHGDFTTIEAGDYEPIDLLVGGTPCQSFSVAGLRGGMADDRGNLALEYLRLADRLRPRWLVWENVPGVLSSNGGRDFGAFIGGLGELGYGWAYRTVDAQFFGVAQRRRRVFVVGHLGDWRRAAAVLFERQSLSGDPPPSRAKGQNATGALATRAGGGGWPDGGDGRHDQLVAGTLAGGARKDGGYSHDDLPMVAATLESTAGRSRGAGTPVGMLTSGLEDGEIARALNGCNTAAGRMDISVDTFVVDEAVAFKASHYARGKDGAPDTVAPPLSADADKGDQDTLIFAQELADPITAHERDSYTHEGSGNFRTRNVIAIQESGKRTGASTDDPKAGIGIAEAGDPMYALGADSRHAVAFALRGRDEGNVPEVHDDGEVASALRAASGGSTRDMIAFDPTQITQKENRSNPQPGDPVHTLATTGKPPAITGAAVRRLTPRECERLMGAPDDYTLIPWRRGLAPDGPRYRVLGNSFVRQVVAWIGERIQAVEDM